MKKGILIMLALAILFVTVLPAISYARGPGYNRGWGSGHNRGWGPRPYYRGSNYGWGIAGAAAGGLVLGTIIGSSMSSRPVYVEPRRVYVVPPPPPPGAYYYYPPPERVYVYPY